MTATITLALVFPCDLVDLGPHLFASARELCQEGTIGTLERGEFTRGLCNPNAYMKGGCRCMATHNRGQNWFEQVVIVV